MFSFCLKEVTRLSYLIAITKILPSSPKKGQAELMNILSGLLWLIFYSYRARPFFDWRGVKQQQQQPNNKNKKRINIRQASRVQSRTQINYACACYFLTRRKGIWERKFFSHKTLAVVPLYSFSLQDLRLSINH